MLLQTTLLIHWWGLHAIYYPGFLLLLAGIATWHGNPHLPKHVNGKIFDDTFSTGKVHITLINPFLSYKEKFDQYLLIEQRLEQEAIVHAKSLVSEKRTLSLIINFGLYWCSHSLHILTAMSPVPVLTATSVQATISNLWQGLCSSFLIDSCLEVVISS